MMLDYEWLLYSTGIESISFTVTLCAPAPRPASTMDLLIYIKKNCRLLHKIRRSYLLLLSQAYQYLYYIEYNQFISSLW